MHYQNILDFWFIEIDKKKWFQKDTSFDALIRERFFTYYQAAIANELNHWRSNIQGRLAEIIVLDQFSRNLFRDSAQAFSADPLALCLAQHAVELQLDQQLELSQRSFLYMPYMHSESKHIHQQALELFSTPGMENNYHFELRHKKIIDQFGRYPHRNEMLNRESTAEEKAFLTQPGSSF
ncbi:MAG: DUF924 family protein [bacterium]